MHASLRAVLPLLAAAALLLAACGDGENAPSASSLDRSSLLAQDTTLDASLAQILARRDRFSVFATMLDSARLLSTLAGEGSYTVFAATDDGLDELPSGLVEELLLPANRDRLRQIVAYHVHRGALAPDSLPEMSSVSTLTGQPLSLATEGGRVLVGNERVSEYAVTATNGRIFALDALVMPPVDGATASIPDGGAYDSLGVADSTVDSLARPDAEGPPATSPNASGSANAPSSPGRREESDTTRERSYSADGPQQQQQQQ